MPSEFWKFTYYSDKCYQDFNVKRNSVHCREYVTHLMLQCFTHSMNIRSYIWEYYRLLNHGWKILSLVK
jgi:hypothetical protein